MTTWPAGLTVCLSLFCRTTNDRIKPAPATTGTLRIVFVHDYVMANTSMFLKCSTQTGGGMVILPTFVADCLAQIEYPIMLLMKFHLLTSFGTD